MKKLMQFIMPVKTLASMIFAGLICAYVVAGCLWALITGQSFAYTIPFIFVAEGIALAIVIAVLWELLLGDQVIRKMRYFPRLILFALALAAALAGSLGVFFAQHTDWAKLWLIVVFLFMAVVITLSVIGEIYYRVTGKKYTELLNEYKANILS